MGTFNIHAGHGLSGGLGCGAVGILDESLENRNVKNEIIRLLRSYGQNAYDCTCESNASQNSILTSIVNKCNEHNVDYDISIHLNSGRNDYDGDKTTGGVECYVYNSNEDTVNMANLICNNISSALNIINRGVKLNTSLYVLRKTKSPAILVECCFVDDKDDADRWDANKCASAIAQALMGGSYTEVQVEPPKAPEVKYPRCRAHMKDIGWGDWVNAGEIIGTVGEHRRIEAIQIDYPDHDVSVGAHIENLQWVEYNHITKDTVIGTTGRGLRLEALRINCNSLNVRAQIENQGWGNTTKCDGIVTVGTVGMADAIEALIINEN